MSRGKTGSTSLLLRLLLSEHDDDVQGEVIYILTVINVRGRCMPDINQRSDLPLLVVDPVLVIIPVTGPPLGDEGDLLRDQ